MGGKISMVWQSSQYAQWTAQYGVPMSEVEASDFENKADWDGEKQDPDGGGPLAKHASVAAPPYNNPAKNANDDFGTGDGFTAFEEYRGFVGASNDDNKYSHRRLSACEKEVLIEIDVMAAASMIEYFVETKSGTVSGVDDDTIRDINAHWTLHGLEGLWITPSTDFAENNFISYPIKTSWADGQDVYWVDEFDDLKRCTSVGATYSIDHHEPFSVQDVQAIMGIVRGIFWDSAGIRIFYVIDQVEAPHKKGKELDSDQKRGIYAEMTRGNLTIDQQTNTLKEDYRRFLHLIFGDYCSDIAYAAGVSQSGNIDADQSPVVGDSDKHCVFVFVPHMRNRGRMGKTYLGAATLADAQRQSAAITTIHELGHALRIQSHYSPSTVDIFKIQSDLRNAANEPIQDDLYFRSSEYTHPNLLRTNHPEINWKLWLDSYDTIGELFDQLAGKGYTVQWTVADEGLIQQWRTWPVYDFYNIINDTLPRKGGPDWMIFKAFDKKSIMTDYGATLRVMKESMGFAQTTALRGTPYISVKYHYGAPSR